MGELTRCLVDMLNQQGSLDDADALASALDSSGFPLASLILKEGQRRPPGGTFMAGVSEFYISPDRLQTDALLEAISERYFIPIDKLEETFLDLRRGFLLHTHVPSLETEPDTEQHIHMVVSSLLIGGSLTAGVCNVEGAKLLSSTLGSNDRLQELQALLNGESEAVRDFLESVCMAVDPFPALQAVTTVGFATIGVSSWEGTSWELEFLLEMAPPGGVEERQKIRRGVM